MRIFTDVNIIQNNLLSNRWTERYVRSKYLVAKLIEHILYDF